MIRWEKAAGYRIGQPFQPPDATAWPAEAERRVFAPLAFDAAPAGPTRPFNEQYLGIQPNEEIPTLESLQLSDQAPTLPQEVVGLILSFVTRASLFNRALICSKRTVERSSSIIASLSGKFDLDEPYAVGYFLRPSRLRLSSLHTLWISAESDVPQRNLDNLPPTLINLHINYSRVSQFTNLRWVPPRLEVLFIARPGTAYLERSFFDAFPRHEERNTVIVTVKSNLPADCRLDWHSRADPAPGARRLTSPTLATILFAPRHQD